MAPRGFCGKQKQAKNKKHKQLSEYLYFKTE